MPDQANVQSSDAIEQVRAALLQFAKQAEEGLTECQVEMRRFVDWMEHDRPKFWKRQVQLAHDGVQKAKQDLHRCLMYPVGVNDRPACTEERALLKKAEAKLAYCQEKQERLRHWVREISHELHTYEGRTTRLREVIEADTPAAAAALSRMMVSLEQYAGVSKSGAAVVSKSTAAPEGTSEAPASESSGGQPQDGHTSAGTNAEGKGPAAGDSEATS